MYLSLVFFPLLGFLSASLFGRFLAPRGVVFITVFCVLCSFVCSLISFFEVGFCQAPAYLKFLPWFDVELFDACWGFCFDSLSVALCLVVTLISALVHIYSTSYMSHDPHQIRFMSYLSLFTFSMLMLTSADNFVQLFFGWEAVGLCSYLLINFWFTRLQANKAAIKAMVVNRIGDFGLALGVFLIFTSFKTIDYCAVFALVPYFSTKNVLFLNFEIHLLTAVGILLFIGSMGKSAQLGLHVWLPDAMEGPTPVSALIHAATMVTAGVFLIIRCSIIYEHSYLALLFITFFGGLTAFCAAIIGVLQNDLKKVIAYSTCSQLGYMVFACGLSNYAVSMFHLMNHAYFKALLFLTAGAIIHSLANEQDFRKMGGLLQILPFSYSMMLIGSLALMGFPFLTGFYSKDVILEIAYANYNFSGIFAFWLGLVSAGFTAFYSIRLIFLTFVNNSNSFKQVIQNIREAPFGMCAPLVVLGFCSIFVGFLTKDLFIGLGTPFWNNAIFNHPEHVIFIDAEFMGTFVKWGPVFISFLGSLSAFMFYSFGARKFYTLYCSRFGNIYYQFVNRKLLFDKLQKELLGAKILFSGYFLTYKIIDKGLIEFVGPSSLVQLILSLGLKIVHLQSGLLNHYLFLMFAATILCLYFMILFVVLPFYFDVQLFFVLVLLGFCILCKKA